MSRLRFSASVAANVLAWGVVGCLLCAAVVMVAVLGFFGLLLLGAGTWLVCVLAALNREAPTWGVEVFRARTGAHGSPEQRAAMMEDRQAFLSPLRFYRGCGMVLSALGAAGLAYRAWAS